MEFILALLIQRTEPVPISDDWGMRLNPVEEQPIEKRPCPAWSNMCQPQPLIQRPD